MVGQFQEELQEDRRYAPRNLNQNLEENLQDGPLLPRLVEHVNIRVGGSVDRRGVVRGDGDGGHGAVLGLADGGSGDVA